MAGEESESPTQITEKVENPPNEDNDSVQSDRIVQLPLSRIKHLIKMDPDVTLASQEAVVTLAKATELFVQMVSKDASSSMMQGKRKTLQRKDLDQVLLKRDCYCFLEGAID